MATAGRNNNSKQKIKSNIIKYWTVRRAILESNIIAEEKRLTPVKRLFRMLSLDKNEIFIIYAYAIFNGGMGDV